jgi:hypothetical protein
MVSKIRMRTNIMKSMMMKETVMVFMMPNRRNTRRKMRMLRSMNS